MKSHPSPGRIPANPFSARRLRFAPVGLLLVLMSNALGAGFPPCPGITEPFLDVTLSASVPGIITARNVKEGDFVEKGTVLLELDKRVEELEVERRQVVRDEKQKVYESTKQLFGTTKGVSKDELDEKESDYKIASVEHAMAVEQLHRRQVVSSISGSVVEIMLETGEACEAYQPLVRVVDVRQCYFIANLEAGQAATLKLNQPVKLEIDTGAGPLPVSGKIVFLSPVVDPASGLQRVKVLFDNQDGKVRPGVSGRMLTE